ncbi:MAG TPA: DUF975 family protein [Candidatus Ruthenibacterium merdigallinarum]|nr:DUF975 family protein [Candidatus Ruthenibacterium merdigallinarum]
MKLTSQLRKYAKAKSMAALKANFWRTLGVYAMYYLLFAAVGVLGVLLFLGILLGAAYSMLPQMTVLPSSPEAIAMAMVGPIVAAYALVIVLVVLAAGPLTLLVTHYQISLQRGAPLTVGQTLSVLGRGRMLWNSIKLTGCLVLRAFLWSLLLIFIMLVLAAGTGSGGMLSVVFFVVYAVVYFGWGLFLTAKLDSYSGAWVLLEETPHLGAWEATKMSAQVFRGSTGGLIVFRLSFILWGLLDLFITLMLVVFGNAGMSGAAVVLMLLAMLVLQFVYTAQIGTYTQTSLFEIFDVLRRGEPVWPDAAGMPGAPAGPDGQTPPTAPQAPAPAGEAPAAPPLPAEAPQSEPAPPVAPTQPAQPDAAPVQPAGEPTPPPAAPSQPPVPAQPGAPDDRVNGYNEEMFR